MNISRRQWLAFTAGVITTAVSTPGWAQHRDQPSGGKRILRIAVSGISNNGTLSTLREQSNVGKRVLPSLLEPLIAMDVLGDLSLQPGLAQSWRRIDDKTIEISLRRGVRFHNGDEMTAEDVAFSFGPDVMFGDTPPHRGEGAKTIRTDNAAAHRASGTRCPAEVAAVGRRLWPSLEAVEVLDPYTVRFVNAVPDLTLEGRLARMGCDIISKRQYQEAGDWQAWASAPVGTGPFKVKTYKKDQHLILEKHADYWGGAPEVDEVHFYEVPEVASRINGMLAGEYDFATDIPTDQIKTIESASKLEAVGGPIINHQITCFDKHHPVLADPRVRRAMAHAIDRQLIVEMMWGGRTVVPQGLQFEFYGEMFDRNHHTPEYNPELAQRLLKEAGYQGEVIPYRVLNNYYTGQVQKAQIMVEMWRSVGLNVQMQMVENWSQIYDASSPRGIRDWSNSAGYNDPVSSLVNQHGPNGQQQQKGEWNNEEFNRLSGLLETSTDPAERQRVYARMLRIAEYEDPAYLVVHQTAAFYAKRKDIHWKWSPTFYMDFRRGNTAEVSV
ncbi:MULTISPECIES: ABC transporter substrate-binding protein [unclassified Bordetella]|uniref:ABC transporter substrate-binding protein n=1 Tax=unclassified Bordetella TaxID=2630031 RepID=UPI001320BDFD|nr:MULTISPECIES: ABC transporter substrate-binding protein [unclassified Bordetella]MVW71158.1 ABC transporter substrate-binding protein [Bordetella sp. 15P40C-2]MVW80727.1 ABC transporter substrate-binding protein [Bordetella sp. 02P26C-1]